MNWLQFFSSIVGSVTWPAAVVAIVLLLRGSIISLLPRLRRLKYKEVEAEFGEKLDEVEHEVARLPETPAQPQARREIEQEVRDTADFSANSAILIAWLHVESAILALARSANVLDPNTPAHLVARRLRNEKLIDEATYRTIRDMESLRNLAVHPEDTRPITNEQVERYKKLAEKIMAVLENIRQTQGH